MLTNKFEYQSLSRIENDGKRQYMTKDGPLPSVTTILSATMPEEKRAVLSNWRKAVGENKAAEIVKESSSRGTRMHKWLENYVKHDQMGVPGTNPYSQQSHEMAKCIIKNGLANCSEFWGTEVNLYYPSLYAGTTDLIGVHKGDPAILDFKQTNKPKKREWIDDYFIQLLFYGMAHNELYGTKIKKGVILMCSPDFQYQEFILEGKEWDSFEKTMWDRLEIYYKKLYPNVE